jgi:hypothetical protein
MSQITALFVTLSIEVLAVLLVVWIWRVRVGVSWAMVVLVAMAASLVTHPFAWYFNGALSGAWSFAIRATAIETFVVLAEMAIFAVFARMSWRVAFTVSFLANMSSFGAGLFWFYFLR